jgi:cytochrome c oxidase accessory protein FixG
MTVVEKVKTPEDYITPGEAAPGVSTVDVEAVNRKANRELYAVRQKVHPRRTHGVFRNLKWLVMIATLGVYYIVPWIRWPRGGDLPDQAFLIDVANGRLFLGPIEIWPQELYYVTGILIISALALFLATSVAGRVWCGYTCPQTVWTDLMVAVERFWQGDRSARIRLDKAPWSLTKLYKKGMTHLTWALIGLVTGGALVFYFRDAPTLAQELLTGTAPAIAYLFLGIFTFTTYLLGGIAREQVCIYMCPWPRIQGAMTDRHTLLVSYRPERGEPRGPKRRDQSWDERGDCIDCKACVVVCPTGIDIRDGSQLECIQCALCIDACNEIMDKIGRPRNLIAYDTVARREASTSGEHEPFKLVRVRTLLYAGLIVLVGAIMLVAFANRSTLDVNVLRDRAAMFVRLSDGGVRNGYTLKVLNKAHAERTFVFGLDGLPGGKLRILGRQGENTVTVPTDDLREIRVFVALDAAAASALKEASTPFRFTIADQGTGKTITRTTVFQAPVN